MTIRVVILAAGQGKRMYSSLPKVLHHLAGKPMLEHVIDTAAAVTSGQAPIIIYGHQGDAIRGALSNRNIVWAEQKEQLGTGHALMQAMPHVTDEDSVLVLYGDVPLISEHTLRQLIETSPKNAISMLTAYLDNPKGYGRIKRNAQGEIIGIVEDKDTTPDEAAIKEINPGIYYVPAKFLKKWLPALKNQNAQGEYYLTDIITHAVQEQIPIHYTQPERYEEILGVNDRLQLAQLERFYQRQQAEQFLRKGVMILDPARFDLRGDLQVGRDVVIDVNVIFEGRVVVGDNVVIGANTILRDVVIHNDVVIQPNCVIEEAEIGSRSSIGPFARIRPGTVLVQDAHIGNFVELKNSRVGQGSKINHLSYVGDAEVGQRVNIGAGTITCNYDGANKHKTIIQDDVHVGSDTQLVAPVVIGAGATIGAGSTITKDVPAETLTLTHKLEQRSNKTWQRPKKPNKT